MHDMGRLAGASHRRLSAHSEVRTCLWVQAATWGPALQGTRSDLPRCPPLLPTRGFLFGRGSDALLRHRHPPLVVLNVRPRLPRPGEPLIERSSDLVCGVPYLGQVIGV